MNNAQKVLDHLSEAARLLSHPATNLTKNGFSDLIEVLVDRANSHPEANMVCSMLYAARESVEMKQR